MKKNYLQESPRLCLSVIWLCIGVGLFLFLDSVFAYHFRFIEQFRLFRFSAEYAQEHFSYPGGPAFYGASGDMPSFGSPAQFPSSLVGCRYVAVGCRA